MAQIHPLLDIAYKCGVKGYILKDIYRRMLDKSLFLIAYGNLYDNDGALTPGTDFTQTLDGMSEKRLDKLIERLKNGTFHWTPVRRVYIPKKRGGTRALGLPNVNDKLVQEVIHMILESYYEPQFKESSHGFRPQRSCHTALKKVVKQWQGVTWFIEGDIKGCFDNISHDHLMKLLERSVKDTKFLKLIRQMLEAGYLEDWKRHKTFSGVPQGGVASPLLSNIVLNELDRTMEEELIPGFNKGKKRRLNSLYGRHLRMYHYHRKRGNHAKAVERQRQMRQIARGDRQDPNYRRLRYIRYADDFLIGVIGPKQEAETIKDKVGKKLAEMSLTMSEEKTLITHARTQRARFLGFEVTISDNNTRMASVVVNGRKHKRRSAQGVVRLYMPQAVVTQWSQKYTQKGQPVRLQVRTHLSDLEILDQYGSEIRGLANYYMPACNVSKAIGKVTWYALQSAVKTLAFKYKEKTGAIWRKYWKLVHTGKHALYAERPKPNKSGEVYKAMCGEVSFKAGEFKDKVYDRVWTPRYDTNELVQRLTAQQCELCGATGQSEVHHIRKLKNLQQKWVGHKDKPDWVKFMVQRHRKTIVLCTKCHRRIHKGTYDGAKVR